MFLMASGSLLLLIVEVLICTPRILFGRYLWIDELLTKLIESKPSISQSLVALQLSGDFTPPTYHLLARASWGLLGGSGETAFRTLSFVSIWVALVLTYAVLRRSFAVLPALVTVLAFWSNPTIIPYAFFARSYAPLIAATAGFCLVYGQDKKGSLGIALTAALAALICTLHYFGIFALASIVLGDAFARREPLPAMIRRWAPVAAGPIAVIACWPFIRTFHTGQIHSWMPPLTSGFAVQALWSWASGALGAAGVLFIAWRISIITVRRRGEEPQPIHIGPLQPVAGLFGLVLVPIFVAIFSALVYPAMNTRYMLPGLLGLTSLLAILASKISPRILAGAAILLILLGAANLRVFSETEMKWQTTEDQMMRVGQFDQLAIVTFNMNEAYLLYDYAPGLRNRLFIADLRQTHKAQLSRNVLLDNEYETRWLTVYPDLPKLLNLDQLQHLGKFHLLNSEAPILANQESQSQPLSLPLEKIAHTLSFQRVGDLYQVPAN
jgi:uncharacterized membrane protein